MPCSRSSLPRIGGALAFAAACGGSSPPDTPPPAPATAAAPAAAPLRLARVNGTLLHFRLAGDSGTPVAFLHGSLGNLRDWDAQVSAFARSHHVLVYSRRYHPPNPRQEDRQVYSPALHAEDLAALLQATGLAPAHLVAHSYGAYVALVLALEHPEMVRSLVLAEPLVIPLLYRTNVGDSLRRVFFAAALDPARAAFQRGDSVEALRRFLDGVSGMPGRFDNLPPQTRAEILSYAFELRRELLAEREQYLPEIGCAALGRLATPALLVAGARSPRMFHVINEELARCLRTDTAIVVPEAAHGIQRGNPAYFNRAVLHFLATH